MRSCDLIEDGLHAENAVKQLEGILFGWVGCVVFVDFALQQFGDNIAVFLNDFLRGDPMMKVFCLGGTLVGGLDEMGVVDFLFLGKEMTERFVVGGSAGRRVGVVRLVPGVFDPSLILSK